MGIFFRPIYLLTKVKIANFFLDARHFQLLFLGSFLLSGILLLGWHNEIPKFLTFILVALGVQLAGVYATHGRIDSLKSALITSFGLCLMCKTNHIETAAFAALIAIGSKFLIRFNNKHIFNPVNMGIIGTILFTGDSWISPGQWGSNFVLVFMVGIMAFLMLKRVNRLDTSVTFLIVFGGLHFVRSVIYQGWGTDVFVHQMTSGTLMLFTFFMITDPMTTPNSRIARIIWTTLIGIAAFYLGSTFQVYAAPVWVLFFASPLVPLMDKLFTAQKYEWRQRIVAQSSI
jgi:Na+-transporting NADH:ubiquinone oxidoreductase subunit NqrB